MSEFGYGKSCGGSRLCCWAATARPALGHSDPRPRHCLQPPAGSQLIAPRPPAAQGPRDEEAGAPMRPAVITAAVAAARRVSASAPPPRLIGAASGAGRGRRRRET